MIEKLNSYWGFSRSPFGRDLAPAMLHRHGGHNEAVARIGWCITERLIAVVTGEVGAGKTVAIRAALASLDASRYSIIYISNPMIGARGINHAVVSALGGRPRFGNAALTAQAADALADEYAERGRTAILVIDEAHLLTQEQLETLRMLTNYELDSASYFALLLVGQPTLRRRMKLGVLAALDQRIALRYTLPGMSAEETASYLKHHAELVGRSDTLFSDDAVALIHHTARGYPRAVNNLAIQALTAAFSEDKSIVDESCARAAVAEITAD